MSDSPYIFEATQQNFDSVVLENSATAPVLVDFWAEWCGPCKMLMPLLSKLAEEYQGKFLLAKVNTEQQQELAARHGIRSIPTLKLYKDGKQVEEIFGAQPEPALRQLIERYITRESDLIRAEASAAYRQGDADKALALLATATDMDPGNHQVTLDRAGIQADRGELEQAQQSLQDLPPDIRNQTEATTLLARIEFARITEGAPDATTLEQAIAADPGNSEARLQLGSRQVLSDDYEPAMEQFLAILQRDRGFRDDAGHKALLAVFQLLEGQDELVSRYRKRMFNALH